MQRADGKEQSNTFGDHQGTSAGNLYLLPCYDSLEAILLSTNNWAHCFTA